MPVPVPFAQLWEHLPAELKLSIFFRLPLRDVINFSYVSLHSRLFALHSLRQRLSELLLPYHLNVYSVFLALDRCNTVVAGSTALELVCPSSITPNNIDFLCPITEANLFISYLIHNDYRVLEDPFFGPPSIDDDPGQNAVRDVVILYHPTTNATIHAIISVSSSALAPLFQSHSTFVMNFISASGFYSCYPELTAEKEGFRNVTDVETEAQPRRRMDEDKYIARGFRYRQPCPPKEERELNAPPRESCLHSKRELTDNVTAILPFNVFHLSASYWPKTKWRLGFILKRPGRSNKIIEGMVGVSAEGKEEGIHCNHTSNIDYW
ncbi:hypothetical protein DFP72DRAFT_1063885 [Ephemerocybe angulata]|uniref:F-box domain-containing protein n=1 Tax=Ephemerocybe angulata TaxID=980116 RepID=A0A8H6I901_9AGAR|nr:hypothetical protein DFP72DRAFT_1063885 [Tulosesus angulatus]